MRMRFYFSLVLTVALVSATAAAPSPTETTGGPQAGQQWTEVGQHGAALPEMVVEAENRVRQTIEKSGFMFKLDAASVDSLHSAMDELVLAISPVSGLQPHLNNLEPLRSEQPPHFWLPEFPIQPVATFYPQEPEGHRVRDWHLTITDFRGSPARTFAGKGQPPSVLHWDGRSDHGEILQVGYPYSFVFSTTDRGTNTYNHAGESFRLPALDYRQDGDRVLAIAGGELFPRRESSLIARGEDWLVRAADEIRRHPYSPVRVVVTAETMALAEQRADKVATHLAESMILPREQIETRAQQRPDLRAELDGQVAVIIEHAD